MNNDFDTVLLLCVRTIFFNIVLVRWHGIEFMFIKFAHFNWDSRRVTLSQATISTTVARLIEENGQPANTKKTWIQLIAINVTVLSCVRSSVVFCCCCVCACEYVVTSERQKNAVIELLCIYDSLNNLKWPQMETCYSATRKCQAFNQPAPGFYRTNVARPKSWLFRIYVIHKNWRNSVIIHVFHDIFSSLFGRFFCCCYCCCCFLWLTSFVQCVFFHLYLSLSRHFYRFYAFRLFDVYQLRCFYLSF